MDLSGIADLVRISQRDGWRRIGALVRHDSLAETGVPGPLGALRREVVPHIAHWPMPTRGTLSGGCCRADPAAEWPLVTTVLGATMVARPVRGDVPSWRRNLSRGC
jgi:carbon-monoxide dehydrogenase medium subunit